MPFVVVYDACILFSPGLRDTLVRIARAGLVQARWTERILDEAFLAIEKARPRVRAEALQRTRRLLVAAVPDCMVTGYEELVEGLRLPDAEDRHVLAAAIRCGAQTIVTSNLKDFPDHVLSPFQVEAQSPDEFVTDMLDLEPRTMLELLHQQASDLRNPPRTLRELLGTLRKNGLHESVAKIHELLERLEG